MVLSDTLKILEEERGLKISDTQLRWAIRGGKISRPALDGSLRFDFTTENLDEIERYFRSRETNGRTKPVCV